MTRAVVRRLLEARAQVQAQMWRARAEVIRMQLRQVRATCP